MTTAKVHLNMQFKGSVSPRKNMTTLYELNVHNKENYVMKGGEHPLVPSFCPLGKTLVPCYRSNWTHPSLLTWSCEGVGRWTVLFRDLVGVLLLGGGVGLAPGTACSSTLHRESSSWDAMIHADRDCVQRGGGGLVYTTALSLIISSTS